MTRYTDAEALKQDLIRQGISPAIVNKAIEEAPTVDIIMCKDCIYGHYDGDGYWICDLDDCYVDDTYYCNNAEQK